MICRSTPNGRQILIGLTKKEIDDMLANRDKCAHVASGTSEITIFVVDGDDAALEAEFLRIVAISVTPDPGAKPQ